MRASDCDILIVPGIGGGTPQHWYMRWAQKLSSARRVEQVDFNRPILKDWRCVIEREAHQAKRPVVLVAHGLGAIAAVHASATMGNGVAAFLVAPPSRDKILSLSEIDPLFADAGAKLNFPAILVASRSDPYCAYEQAEIYARQWGAECVDAGDSGHIHPESGHGPWPEGLLRFAHFLSSIPAAYASSGAQAR